MFKKMISALLVFTMLFTGSMLTTFAAEPTTVLNDPIAVEGATIKSMEGESMIGWNGWDDWSNNNPSVYENFMTATVEKAPEDSAKTFAEANKVMNFTLGGIYNTTGRPSGAISCGSNFHVNKFLKNPRSGKVRIKTKLYNASTEEGKNVSFNFVIGDQESAASEALEKRLINAEIYGSTIEIKSNFGGGNNQKATAFSNAIPVGKWFELAIELDTEAKTWSLFVDGEKVGNGTFVGDSRTVNLVAYSINRSGNTAFLNSSNADKLVSWYADDLEIQTYTDPGYKESGMPGLNDNWEQVSGEDFESATSQVDTMALNNWGTKQWKIRSGSSSYSSYQNVEILAEDSTVDFAQSNKLLSINLPATASQNIRPWWRIYKNGGNITDGLVKISTRLNAKDAGSSDLYLYATTESDWNYTKQINPDNGADNDGIVGTYGGYGLNKVRLYVDSNITKVQLQPTSQETDTNYAAFMEDLYPADEWFPVDMIYNLNTNKVTVYINNQRVAYRAKSGTGLSDVTEASFLTSQSSDFDWNIGNLITMIQRDAGTGTWLVDDITVSVLSGYNTVESEKVTENLSEQISIPTSWTQTGGEVVTALNPANEADHVLYLKENSGAYGSFDAQNGIVTAQADIYVSEHNKRMLPYKMYLADKDGNRLTEIRLDEYSIKNGFAESESPDRVGASQVEWEELAGTYNYPLGSWFTLKAVVDTTKRVFDIYIDDTKINSGVLDFYSTVEPTDNGLVSCIGFETLSTPMYVNNVVVTQTPAEHNIYISEVTFADANGADSAVPTSGGTVKSVTINNTAALDGDKVIYAAVYNADGELEDVAKTVLPASTVTGVTTIELTAAQLPETWTEDCSVRVFIFDSTSNLNPLTGAYTYGVSSLPTIYITGDSINTNYDAVEYPRGGWGYELKALLDSDQVRIINRAASGNSTNNFIDYGRLRSIEDKIKPGDYLFISTIHNDRSQGVDEATYKANLRTYVDMATSHGAKCVFVTSPYFRTDADDSRGRETFVNYTNWLTSVANANNAPVIDLFTRWEEFKSGKDAEELKAYYNYVAYDSSKTTDYRWSISEYNENSVNYDSTRGLVFEDGLHLSVRGAKIAASFVAEGIKALNLPISSSVKNSEVSYSVNSGTMTVTGQGELPAYASFKDTPWSSETGIKNIEVADGVTSMSANAFSGFSSLESVTVPESVEYISAGSLPEKNVTMYGYANSAAQEYAETDANVEFYLKKLRILSIGNSHTSDYSQWRDLVFSDLKNAGLKTEIVFDSVRNGGYQMYDTDYPENAGGHKTHYEQGTNKVSSRYDEYADKLGNYKWDLVIIQDYQESALGNSDFTKGIAKTMRWLRDKQPNAQIAWLSDWTDKSSLGVSEGNAGAYGNNKPETMEKVKNLFLTNSLGVINEVESMDSDKPDFIIHMGTALQNARTSYLATTCNAADCYNNPSNTDWANGTIHNYNLLERDQTHCSYELGRYLVGAAVFARIFDEYKGILEGADFDYYNALKTAPTTSGSDEWKGDFTDSIWDIIKESARNMMAYPKSVTQSVYTVDPADGIADAISGASYADFTQSGIANTVNSLGKGITVTSSDVTVSDNTATVTFLYGYTKKTVTITK